MRTIYRTGFPINISPNSDTLAAAAKTCLAWILSRPGVEATHRSLSNEELKSLPITKIGSGNTIETRFIPIDSGRAWAARFKHPHRDNKEIDDQIEWITEIGITERAKKMNFCCSVSVGRSDSAFAPVRFSPTRPRIILEMLKHFHCGGKVQLLERPYVLKNSASDARLFRTLLENTARQHPVVFITPEVPSGEFAADYKGVASELAGLAYVVVADSPDATRMLGNELPSQLNCWDGAVRVYWPGFSVIQSPYAHPLYDSHKVYRLNDRYPAAFAKELLKRISSVAVISLDPDWLTWASVERYERMQAIERAKTAGDTEELLRLYVADKENLDATVNQLKAQLERKERELQVAQAKIGAFEAAFDQMKQGEAVPAEEDLPPSSVAEAVSRANKKFGAKFVLAWNSKSETDSLFEDPDEVFQAFVWLATNYYDSKTGKRSGLALKEDMRQSMEGWFYSGGQNEALMRDFKEWYQCQALGKKYWLGEHIGTGSSKDPRETIRIGFTWDREAEKVILGFIGQHQCNRAT